MREEILNAVEQGDVRQLMELVSEYTDDRAVRFKEYCPEDSDESAFLAATLTLFEIAEVDENVFQLIIRTMQAVYVAAYEKGHQDAKRG